MNMQNLMAQAQKVQKELEKANNEIENSLFEGNSNNVVVVIDGKHNVKSITFSDEDILKDKEMLEDLLLVAFNDANSKLEKMKKEKLGRYTNGLGGLF